MGMSAQVAAEAGDGARWWRSGTARAGGDAGEVNARRGDASWRRGESQREGKRSWLGPSAAMEGFCLFL